MLGTQASVVAVCGLELPGAALASRCRLSSCGVQAYLLHGMWRFSWTGDQIQVPCIGKADSLPINWQEVLFYDFTEVILKQSHMLKVFPFYR